MKIEELYSINPQEFGRYDIKKATQYLADRKDIYDESPDRELDDDDLLEINELIKR